MGAWAFLSVSTAIATKTLTFPAAFCAFTNDVIWLIVVSFFFARVGLGGGCARVCVWVGGGGGGSGKHVCVLAAAVVLGCVSEGCVVGVGHWLHRRPPAPPLLPSRLLHARPCLLPCRALRRRAWDSGWPPCL